MNWIRRNLAETLASLAIIACVCEGAFRKWVLRDAGGVGQYGPYFAKDVLLVAPVVLCRSRVKGNVVNTLRRILLVGLPLVMCEAISRGVPAVCFPAGGLREMRTFHPGVLIVSPTAEDLKAGVIEMMQRSRQPGFAQELASRYRERLSNQTTIDWWLDLLKKSG